jgi:hypothetical protein
MNHSAQNNYLEGMFSRSCLESAPRPGAPHHASFSMRTPTNNSTQFQLHQLKQKLLHITLKETTEIGLFKQICGVANQAAELAWNESCPLLVFPCLFEELVQLAREQFQQEQAWQLDESPWPPAMSQNTDTNGDYPRRVLSMPSETG